MFARYNYSEDSFRDEESRTVVAINLNLDNVNVVCIHVYGLLCRQVLGGGRCSKTNMYNFTVMKKGSLKAPFLFIPPPFCGSNLTTHLRRLLRRTSKALLQFHH